ncbi:MAG TPA: hypothetical protein EYG03_08520 [Planctomycetes bacterium]|nr:hypothetical protein [Fuerstiella sp.]HIK92010.1 hypothetical protein [Planctomycetota bacterium]
MKTPSASAVLALVFVAAVTCHDGLLAFQEQDVPNADTPKGVNPLAGEDPPATRVAKGAARVGAMVGDETGVKITALLRQLFDSTLSDDVRLDAGAQLSQISGALDASEPILHSAQRQLDRRVRLATAGIQALKDGESGDDARKLVNDLLLRACVDYENGSRDAHAEVVRVNYELLKQQHPAIFAKVGPIVLEDYYNYNLHFVLSEPLLSRIVSDYRTESGPVADCILGAWVTGKQVTDTMVRADVKPSPGTARFDLVVDGRTKTNTQARKSPATIYSNGNHSFTIRKPLLFDGSGFSTEDANMEVDVDNRTVRVSTDYDRIPIFSGIARGVARKEVRRKQYQADGIAARKLADRALPKFEEEANDQLVKANGSIQDNILQNLRDRGIAPTAYSARSSETHFAVSSRTMSPRNLAASRPPSNPAPRKGVAIQLHESTINAAIDGLGIAGEMTVAEVLGTIETALKDLLDREVSLRDPDEVIDDKTDFDFSEFDPIRVRFDEGQVVFILRTGFYQKDKNRRVPRYIFEIPLGIEVRDGSLVLTAPRTDPRGILSLRPRAIEGKASLKSVAQARGIAKELLDKTFKQQSTELDSNIELELKNRENLKLQITKLEITDGWVTLIME